MFLRLNFCNGLTSIPNKGNYRRGREREGEREGERERERSKRGER